MVLEIGIIKHRVYKSRNIRNPCCICLRIGTIKGKIELKVREFLFEGLVVLKIKSFFQATCTVEKVNLTGSLFSLE